MLVACAGSVSSIWVVRVQDMGVTVVRLGCGELSAGFDSSFDGGENRSGIRVARSCKRGWLATAIATAMRRYSLARACSMIAVARQ